MSLDERTEAELFAIPTAEIARYRTLSLAAGAVGLVLAVAGFLTHGDEFCTDDVDYQRYRAWSRDPRTKARLRALPFAVRRLVAWSLRRKSRAATARKPESILDVNTNAVEEAFRRTGADELRRAVETVLNDEGLRAGAARVQASFAAAGGPREAADRLERLAA